MPARELVDTVVVDRSLAGETTALADLGVRLHAADLVTGASAPCIDAERLTDLLMSMASAATRG